MANFRPLKKYLLYLIDDLIKLEKAQEPFLDIGCGQGDVTLHLANKGWSGMAIDIADKAIINSKKLLADKPHIRIQNINALDINEKFNTLLLLDVIEHIKDDNKLIAHLKNILNAEGHLIISTPILASEWRWDDEFYGHIRRYEIPQLIELLNNNGFTVKIIWDFTWPVFWLIRRIYTRIIPRKIIIDDKLKNTIDSSTQSAWDHGILTTLFEKIIWWRPMFWLQKKFKNHLVGCECVLIAKLKK